MLKENDLVVVRNRNNGTTGYKIPDTGIHRSFAYNESKKIPFGELQQLQYAPGGDYTLKHLLVIEDPAAVEQLNMTVEPEYFYDEAAVRQILLSGTMDQMEDFLNFAPNGALEVAKSIAVSEEIPDMRKREALSKRTGFNINASIELNHQMAEPTEEPAEEGKKERKAQPIDAKVETPTRKAAPVKVVTPTTATNYKVVSK